MRSLTDGRCRSQISFLRRQFLQDDDLPFGDVLSAKTFSTALATIEGGWVDRVYTPLVTLWLFLGQVLNADHSCRAAVARLIAHRVAYGQSPCSAETGAYCQARKRLPEEFFATAVRGVGRKLEDQAKPEWLWKGHHVYLFDGTTTRMPDTVENRAAYPLTHNQNEGLPLARVAAVVSLSCGVILDQATARYAGKGQGEVTLLRQLSGLFTPGDVVLGNCLMSNWQNLHELGERGVHVVTRLNKALRAVDFRLGERLGKEDHIVRSSRPWLRGIDGAAQRAMPEYVTVRERTPAADDQLQGAPCRRSKRSGPPSRGWVTPAPREGVSTGTCSMRSLSIASVTDPTVSSRDVSNEGTSTTSRSPSRGTSPNSTSSSRGTRSS